MITVDYWTSETKIRIVISVYFALRNHAYWLMRLSSCFFCNCISSWPFLIFQIRSCVLNHYHQSIRLSWSKVSVANSDDLTTRDDTKRRIIYRRFSQKVADLYHSPTIHSCSWILDPDISSRVNNITRIIHKRCWNIRSSMTQNIELQEHLETFTWIFRHIRSRISEKWKIKYLICVFFILPRSARNPSFLTKLDREIIHHLEISWPVAGRIQKLTSL